jgi:hypothetical protein
MLQIRHRLLNLATNRVFSLGQWEPAASESVAALYRWCQNEYGRSTGAIYVGEGSHQTQVGWVFVKRMKYSDARGSAARDYYLQESWVEVRLPCGDHHRLLKERCPVCAARKTLAPALRTIKDQLGELVNQEPLRTMLREDPAVAIQEVLRVVEAKLDTHATLPPGP